MPHDFDAVIIGGGVVGLACAASLSSQGQSVLLLERHARMGQETSSRNSGVLHAGLYYPEASLKARLCVLGRRLVEERCQKRGLPYRKLGKLIIACTETEIPRLLALREQATRNGVELQLLDGPQLRRIEPRVRGTAALLSPETGIIDIHELMRDYRREAQQGGAILCTNTKVTALEQLAEGGWQVSTRPTASPPEPEPPPGPIPAPVVTPASVGETTFVTCRWVVNAAGLAADRVAELAGIDVARAGWRLHPCKGSYFRLSKPFATAVSHLIYPLPVAAGLGVHLTFDMGGALLAGPDTEYVTDRSYHVSPEKAAAFARAVSRFLPGVDAQDLTPAYAGIRPKLQGPGEGFRDFVIEDAGHLGCPGLIILMGIESPGLTASPAIAERVTQMVSGTFSL